MRWYKITKRENRIPYKIWEVRNLTLYKPHIPFKLIKKIHKLKDNMPERVNLNIRSSQF